MIHNVLVASRFPSTMLDDLKEYCEENDLSQSHVIRKGVSRILYGDKSIRHVVKEAQSPQPQVVADGWAHHRR